MSPLCLADRQLQDRWNAIAVGKWHVLDLIGLIVAIVIFYFAGVFMSNVLGQSFLESLTKARHQLWKVEVCHLVSHRVR